MIKVWMAPHRDLIPKRTENGIGRVVEAYFDHLPQYGIELVGPDQLYDVAAAHVGEAPGSEVAHIHGLYWTADYDAAPWEWRVNATVVDAVRKARVVTVPSQWVAETFRRDMHLDPVVVPHGIDLEAWGEPREHEGFCLWNKNRVGDVCNPAPVQHLARQFTNVPFVMTFTGGNPSGNIEEVGLLPHDQMKEVVKATAMYLSTTKETFGIGTLEAMASGVPVLGFAEGGNLELVVHGETGYLAAPGNMQDLVEGFTYVMQNRTALGAAAREHAKKFDWHEPAQLIAQVYKDTWEEKQQPATVAVVIPSYNYADKVGRAIESVLAQDYGHLEAVVVVDDGSPDDGATRRAVEDFTAKDQRVKYLRQENAGVANARNAGIRAVASRYVACLDADDAIQPGFLSACIYELEKDPGIGVAFTKLHWIKPDGSEGISDWPGEPDYQRQLVRANQVPTCAVFRREIWERLGGYRQRYAPKGAGAEDAEFWLRAGAIGYGFKLATTDPLFIYSWQSGIVSGDPDYTEVDWLAWHPWVEDHLHPFASLAKPVNHSHPVRQYDQPAISVVIPYGPGHEREVVNALDSLEAQTYRRWEAIVVNDTGAEGPAEEELLKTFPFVKYLTTAGGRGAGAARNLGATVARAPFLMFLDADDWLYPTCMQRVLEGYEYQEGIVYFDYVGKASVEDVTELAPDLQGRVYHHDDGVAILGHKSLDYDPDKAQAQPAGEYPYIWTNVTCLVPKAWHDELGGFDEAMESWEDVDYHWRMARAGRCYVRVDEELMVYRFNSGARRDAGLQDYQTLVEYLSIKYEGQPTVTCNCGGGVVYRQHQNGNGGSSMATNRGVTIAGQGQEGFSMADEDYVKVRYMSPNRGQHAVIGPVSRKKYGRRGGGQVFYVLKVDAEHSPHLFQPIGDVPGAAVPGGQKIPAAPPATPPPPVSQPAAEPAEPSEVEFQLSRLPGVNKKVATAMEEAGITSAQDILTLGEDGLQSIPGIGPATAEKIYGAVSQLAQVAAAETD